MYHRLVHGVSTVIEGGAASCQLPDADQPEPSATAPGDGGAVLPSSASPPSCVAAPRSSAPGIATVGGHSPLPSRHPSVSTLRTGPYVRLPSTRRPSSLAAEGVIKSPAPGPAAQASSRYWESGAFDGNSEVKGEDNGVDEEGCGVCFDRGGCWAGIRACHHRMCVACATELLRLHPADIVPCPFCRGAITGFYAWTLDPQHCPTSSD